MKNLQKFFLALQEKKEELKDYNKAFLAECEAIPEWEGLMEKRGDLAKKIKQVKLNVAEANQSLAEKIDNLKTDIKSDKEVLSDIILSKYIKGESVEVEDEYKNKYQCSFNFIYKKEI